MIYIIKHREVDTPKIKGYKDLYVGDMCNYLDKEINNKNKLLGYLFERLFTYWILKKNLKVKELEYNETMERLLVTEG